MSTMTPALLPRSEPAANADGLWVLLWSQSQNALHIESFGAMLSKNRSAYADDRRMDYVPLFAGPKDDCDKVSNSVRNTLVHRETLRIK